MPLEGLPVTLPGHHPFHTTAPMTSGLAGFVPSRIPHGCETSFMHGVLRYAVGGMGQQLDASLG